MRIPIRSLGTLALAVGVATCADAPASLKQGGNGPVSGRGMGRISLAPVFTKAAQYVAAHMADFGLTFDHVRVVIVRPVADTLVDTTIVFTPGSGDVKLDLNVVVVAPGESFTGAIDYKNGDAVVFHGEGTVQSYLPGDPVPPPGPITLHYEGQGAAVTHITISPKPVAVVTPNTATLTVTAFDANNTALATPVSWTSSDVSVATISPSGATATLTPTGKRGTVTITALTPSLATDNVVATITLPPASMTLVSGGGQAGKAGAALPQPGVVRVLATDGIGVAGVTVNFAAPTGGKVGAASVTTDATGTASASLTLGGAAGPQGFSATAAGFSVAIPETATAGDPSAIIVASGNGQSDTVKHALKLPFVAKVTDTFGNPIAGVTVNWTRTAGAGTLSAASSVTGADGLASVGYTLGATVGTETVTATVPAIGAPAQFTAQALSSGPSAIVIVSGNGQVARVTQALGAALVVKVTDDAANPVVNGTITWTAVNGTLASPTTTTDATGQSSNTMTLGTVAGAASATATIGGKSVTFTATAQPGIVAQAQFRVQPPNGAPGVALAPAVQVALLDAQGNLTAAVNAVTLAMGANPGGAVLGGTLTKNAAGGIATFNDITLDKAGVGYTLVASSANVPNVTSNAFTIAGGGGGGAKTWTGAVSADWSVAGNWNGGVPGAADNVVIPAGMPNQPALSANANVTDLTIATNAILDVRNSILTASGNVDAWEIKTTGDGEVDFTGAGKTVSGSFFPNVSIKGTIAVAIAAQGVTTFGQNLTIAAGASLTVGAFTVNTGNVTVNGQLTLGAGAAMTSTQLVVAGATAVFSQTGGVYNVTHDATFGGAATAGLITAGKLVVGGSFTENVANSHASFAAGGSHRTVFANAVPAFIVFGDPAQSHFQDLEFAGPAAVTLNANTVALGQLIVGQGASPTVLGGGHTLGVVGLSVAALVLDNTLLTSAGGNIARFDNVTFQNYAAAATPLTIAHPGAAAAFTFNNTQFLVTPTTGSYLNVTDTAPGDGNVLTINLVGSVPADGSGQTATAGGALVHWGGGGLQDAWSNPNGGLWSVGANWSLGRAPIATDAVVIALGGTYTVTLDVIFTGTSISLGGAAGNQTLAPANGATLTLSNGLTVLANGFLNISGSNVLGTGATINQGFTSLKNGTIATPFTNQNALLVNGNSSITGALTTAAGSTITVAGDQTTDFAQLTVTNGFTNLGAINFSSLGGAWQSILAVTNGTLINQGQGTITTQPGAGGPRTIDAELNNQNIVTINALTTLSHQGAAHVNSGSLLVFQDNLALNQFGGNASFTNTGTVNIAAGRTLTVTGGTFNQNAGPLGGFGKLSLNAVTANFTTDFSDANTFLDLTNSTFNGPGSLTNVAHANLTLLNTTIGPTATLNNQGNLVINANNIINGTLTTAAGSVLRLLPDATTDFAQLTVANAFTNLGAIELTSAGGAWQSLLNVTNGTLTNAPGGTITSLVGAGGTRFLRAQLDNQGVITVNQPLTVDVNAVAHKNSGTLDLSAADLTLSMFGGGASFTNTGTVTIGNGHVWLINGGTLNQNAGAIGGAGTLSLVGVTANLGADVTNAVTALTVNASTINGPGKLTNATGQTFTLLASTIGATSGLTNQGTLVVNANSAINGPLTTVAGSTLRVLPDATTDFAQLTVANAFTNLGAIELTSVGGAWQSLLAVTNGTLTNAAGGTITSLVGTGGTRFLRAQLDNQGVITVSQPLTMDVNNEQHKNSGTLDLSAADLTMSLFGTGSFTNTGTVTIGNGHVWSISGGTLNQNAGAIGGAGTLGLASVTANFAVDFDNTVTALTVNSSTINGPGKFTNVTGKTFTLLASTIGATSGLTNQGTLVVNSNSAINGPLTTVAGSTLRVLPDATTDFAQLTIANAFTNLGAIELTSVGGAWQSLLTVTNGSLTNAAGGTITSLVGAGGTRFLRAQLDNQGVITVSQALTMDVNNEQHKNSGTLDLSAANLTMSLFGTGSFTNTGTVTIGNGHVWSISGGTLNLNAGAVGGPGTLNLIGVTANLAADITNAVTALTVNGSTINGPGKLTNVAGQTFTLLASTIGATSGLTNQGLLLVNANSLIDGPLTTVAGSTLRLLPDATTDFAQLTVTNAFTNLGAIELTSVGGAWQTLLTLTNGFLTNAAGGTITSLVGAGGTRFLRAQLDNQGVITVSQPLTIDVNNLAHKNSGTLDLTAADLTLSMFGGSFTNTGTVTIGPGHLWSISGGTLNQNAGAIGGAGTLGLTSVTANFAADFNNAVTALTVNNSTINGPGKFTNATGQTFTLLASTIGATSGLTNQGTLLVNGNSSINGPLTTVAGSTLRIQPDATTDFGHLTVANGFVNLGTIELTSVGGPWPASLAITAGNLTNDAQGTLSSLAGTGGTRTINAAVVNQGTLTVAPLAAQTLSIFGTLNTSGTVNLELGGLAAGTQYDQITVSGATTLGGTLNVNLINGFTPADQNAFNILTFASLVGDFAVFNLPGGLQTWAAGPNRARTLYTLIKELGGHL